MHFVLDDDDLTIVGDVLCQVIGSVDNDVLAIATEALHQVDFSLDDSWPTGEFVEDFIDDVVRGGVEEMFFVDEVA